jgi:hypothetical protein
MAVAPKILITENDRNELIEDVWWFNDEHPRRYDTMLSAQPPDEEYSWLIVHGNAYAEFGPKRGNKIRVEGTKAPPPGRNIAVDVVVKVNQVKSDPTELPVRMPYKLEFVKCPKPSCDVPNGTYGYLSYIGYKVLDQNDHPLPPVLVPQNERFNHNHTYDPPWNANCPGAGSPPCWRMGIACHNPFTHTTACMDVNPRLYVDMIGGEGFNSGFIPQPQHPKSPLGNARVDHFSGAFYIGAPDQGSGVEVQRHWWQKYRDHGRHTHIQSPPP